MKNFAKLSLGAAAILVAGVGFVGTPGCGSNSTPGNSSSGSGSTSGSSSGSSSGSTSGSTSGSSSGSTSGSTSGSSSGSTGGDAGLKCTLSMNASALLSGCPACDTCLEQHNCCASADACLADTGCKAYATCMNNCYNGMTADGGMLPDASQGAEDTCAAACPISGNSMTLYTAFQDCSSPSTGATCDTACSCP